MKYFPKSRVLTNQKADQGQFISANGEEYNGPYYTTFTGESFTGVSPTSGSSFPLTPTPISEAGLTLGIDGIAQAEYNKLIGEHSLYNNYYTYNNYKRQIYKYNKLFDYENNNINNLVGEDSFNKIIDTDYGDKSGYSL